MMSLAAEAVGWVYANGKPQPQSQLVRHLLDFAATKSNRYPDEREVRRFVADICAAIDRHTSS